MVLSISLLAVIAVLPATFLAQRWVYGLPAGWLGSVTGHLRWALVGRFAAVVAPIYVVQAAAMAFASDEVGATAFTGQTVALLAVIALLMPVQSATEEFLFRGVIARGVGSWVASRTTSLVVSALTSTVLFTFLHSSSEPAMVAFFFVFGLLASLLVWRVGGLEGSIVLHASNNAVAFFVAVLLGDALDGGTVVPPVTQALVQIAAAGLAVAAIWYLTARDRPQRVARSHTAADQAVENG